jgi:hypothetical protein
MTSDPGFVVWNWKAALLSAVARGTLFFVVNATVGLEAGLRALATEFLFRIGASGFLGGLTQSLSRIDPPWRGAVAALVLLPAAGHLAEYVVHSAAGTARLTASVGASIGVTCISTLFHLFAMRRGVLVAGPRGRSLRDDLRVMPRTVGLFALAGWRLTVAIVTMLRGRMRRRMWSA